MHNIALPTCVPAGRNAGGRTNDLSFCILNIRDYCTLARRRKERKYPEAILW